jgi:hypothetical protein
MNNYGFLGVVQGGRFRPLAIERDSADSLRLTNVAIQAAQTPESGELSLATYEGSAIMVRGIDNGEWIYSAIVMDQAGPILTAVVREVFDSENRVGKYRLKPLLG